MVAVILLLPLFLPILLNSACLMVTGTITKLLHAVHTFVMVTGTITKLLHVVHTFVMVTGTITDITGFTGFIINSIDNIINVIYNTADKTAIKSVKKGDNMTNTNKNKIKTMTISALLCALGILIPMTFPSIRLEAFGASYTLASHVPVIIAMFISPTVAAFVAAVSTLGFLVAGFHIVVVFRASTHLIFSLIGAYILKKNSHMLQSYKSTALYAVFISLIHGIAEVAVVTYFYRISGMSSIHYENGFFISVILFVGVGTFIHSLVDFSIAVFVWKPLQQVISIPANAKIKIN